MYDPADFTLKDQVAVITGAGAGMGRAIAETFAAAGAAVMVSDLDAGTANTVVKEIETKGGKAAGMACDVTKEADLAALVNETVQKLGKLTILVGNAGGGGPKPFDMLMEDFRWTYELNVFSLFRLAQLAAPEMEKAGAGRSLRSPRCRRKTRTSAWPLMVRPRRRPAIWCARSPSTSARAASG